MISGKATLHLTILAASMLLATTASRAEPPDPAGLLAAIAHPAPAQTGFFERRESPLLAQPLLLRGELEQPRAGSLIKAVQSPYVERLEITDGDVRVEREGQRARKFSLKRAPELVAVNASFAALLGGDLATLEEYFSLQVEGDAAHWQITLTPQGRRLAKKVNVMRLLGGDGELRCVDLDQRGGEISRMWLGEAAADAEKAGDEAARDALCKPEDAASHG